MDIFLGNTQEVYTLIVSMFALSALLSFMQLLGPLWMFRRVFSGINVVLVGVLSGFVMTSTAFFWACIFVYIQLYRLVVSLRIVERRINAHRLKQITLRSETLLLLVSSLIIICITHDIYPDVSNWWHSLAVFQLTVVVVLFLHFTHMRKAMRVEPTKRQLSDDELPTLTVAIPARNETSEVADCIESILENDYPKLEILVLDDCSQDTTSDIIKSFAHRGVRFVKGDPPPEHWISKNYAYEQLLDNASGDFILFCGTDVRMNEHFLRNFSNYIVKKKLTMASILPRRNDAISGSYLLQAMRYWRELVWPKSLHRTPPALSTCWIISKEYLSKKGGFRGLRQHIRPEWPIAAENVPNYRFVRSSDYLDLSSVKNLHAQWDTAIRTRYPELHRRPESVAITTAWQLFVLFGPMIGILYGLTQLDTVIVLISTAALLMLLAIHSGVNVMINGRLHWPAVLLYPYSVILEIVTMNYSMVAYEFGTVTWRGRNVCLPVLDIQHRLPKIQ